MSSFVLDCRYALGDTVLLTAAVRDLHRHFRGRIRLDVRTHFPELWRGNPYLTPLNEYDPHVNVVPCRFDLVARSNDAATHCLHALYAPLSEYFGVPLSPARFHGDIHLGASERPGACLPPPWAGLDVPYWLISTGGRLELTAKWWDPQRYQEVVDHFRGRLLFAQVGAAVDHHPPLDGVLDLRGRTSVRQLVRLVYGADGAVCGVTGLMHLAAAVPRRNRTGLSRPCVVVGGGRESPTWEAYPGHQFLHTVGSLPCCARGGCWKRRAVPLGDGEVGDRPEHLCVDVVGTLPRCLDLIRSADVIRCIERVIEAGGARYLTGPEAGRAEDALRAGSGRAGAVATGSPVPPGPGSAGSTRVFPLNACTAERAADAFIASLPPYPGGFAGRGIVICAGGTRLFTNAWVCLHRLRRLGCRLPIQIWHNGTAELDATMEALLRPLGVECVDAEALRHAEGAGRLHGWALKPYALLASPFEDVLLLDADNMPVRNPEYLFRCAPFRRRGAVFWPDYSRLDRDRPAWRMFGVPYRDEPEVESGQLLVRKSVGWAALRLALWYNEHADFYYRFVHGDKETFHLAWRRLGLPYAMPRRPIERLTGTMCQHDFQGQRVFQHRNLDKWDLMGFNRRVRGFIGEREDRALVRQLRERWDGRTSYFLPRPSTDRARARGAQPSRPARISACMISCRPRAAVRERTLAGLARTDWGRAPVHVIIDEERFDSADERIGHTAWRALRAALNEPADYVLFLEDDLEFNRHLRHNLDGWPPLVRREVALGTLYNPQPHELAADVASQARLADPGRWYGSQAMLLSRAFAEHLLAHWSEGPRIADLKFAHHAGRRKHPIFCHAPSLVQHVGWPSTWGGHAHQAVDFDRQWRTPSTSA